MVMQEGLLHPEVSETRGQVPQIDRCETSVALALAIPDIVVIVGYGICVRVERAKEVEGLERGEEVEELEAFGEEFGPLHDRQRKA